MASSSGYFDLLAFDGTYSSNISFYCVPHEALQLARNWYNTDDTELNCLIPPYSTVMNVWYYPYLYSKFNGEDNSRSDDNTSDIIFRRINVNEAKSYFTDTVWNNGKAFRIIPAITTSTSTTTTKVLRTEQHTLASFKGMPTRPSTVGGNFNWKNESKLYTYPYRQLEVRDGFTSPIYLFPQCLPEIDLNNDSHSLRCFNTINQQGQYGLYVYNYNNSRYVPLNQTINSITMPVLNNTYLDYLYRNEEQLKAAKSQMIYNGLMGVASAAISIGAGIATGGMTALAIGSGVISGANAIGSSIYEYKNAVANEKDMARSANTVNGLYTNYNMSLQQDKFLRILEHRYFDDNMERIAQYFHVYGYAANRLEVPNINSRKYWNYLKCITCNISANGIPKEHLVKLKSIFETGTTVWHISNGTDVGDYSKDNPEVY